MSFCRLDGKTALVTGASRGIGEAIARRLHGQGARVVLAARSVDRLDAICSDLGERASSLELDLADPEQVQGAVRSLEAPFDEVGILVNNAGVTADNLLMRMKAEEWDRVISTNLTGTFAVTKAVARGMVRRRWGRVISISSVVGLMGNAGQANYAAAKAGLVGFSKSLARELGSRNITVNVIAPGYIETAMTAELPESAREELAESILLGRLGAVEDIAAAALYLAGDEASYVTGQVLNVSGGLYL